MKPYTYYQTLFTIMAMANQLKALLKSYVDGDNGMFLSVAMQVAAHEAKQGHGKLAKEIRELIDQAKSQHSGDNLTPIPLGAVAVSHRQP